MANQKQETSVPAKEHVPLEFEVGEDVREFISSLNWNVVPKDEYRQCKNTFIPNIEKEPLLSLQMVRMEKSMFPEQPIEIPQALTEPVTEDYIPGVENPGPALFPKMSTLTEKEQKSLFWFLRKTIVFKTPLAAKEESDFQELMRKAQVDYPVFQEFVQSMWRQEHYMRCYLVKPEIVHFMDSLWMKQSSFILSTYPLLYKLATNIPLNLNDPNNDHTVMEFVKLIAVRGEKNPPKMKKPKLLYRNELLTDSSKLCKIKPIMVPDSMEQVIRQIPPVSADKHLDSLLASEDVDVVITPSGIKTILDNVNIHNEWTLPVLIKNIFKTDGTIKKVVFIDKKLPAHSMSLLDKNKWHAKITSKWAPLLAFKPDLLDDKIHRDKKNNKQKDDLSNNLDSLNTKDQKNVVQPSAKYTQSASNVGRTLQSYEEDIGFDEIPEFGVPEPVQRRTQCKSKILEKEPERCLEEDEIAVNERDKKKYMISPHLEYKHWRLGKSTHFKMSKYEQRTLNLLVRERHDGVLHLREQINFKWTKFVDDVCVSSKLEFQPEYGVSVMDYSSSLREYIDLYLRQTSKLVRVRSIGHTQELMLVEVKTMKELQSLMKDPKRTFDPLYAVLTSLVDMAPGQYMLRHTPRDGTFAQAFISNTHGNDLNLEQMYHSCTPLDINAPPPKIDLCVLTPLHHHRLCPPGLLTPLAPCLMHNKKSILSKRTKPSKKNRQKYKRMFRSLLKTSRV